MMRTESPSPEEIRLARENLEIFTRRLGKKRTVGRIGEPEDEEVFQLSETAVRLLVDLLSEMSHGNSVAVVSLNSEFTTQQAADFLNVSRPHVVRLLEKGEIPFRKVGSHRRIQIEDLIAYKKLSENRSVRALEELTAQAQNLGMGY